MAIKYDPNLDYQNEAIKAVVDLFRGQERSYGQFAIYDPRQYNDVQFQLFPFDGTEQNEVGVANRLELKAEEICANLNAVQQANHLKKTERLREGIYNFAIEMETGTGKTYVYLRTIFELNKHYGFKKFIVLVPSIAIKEGVMASLKALKSHFEYHYAGVPFEYFQYSSTRLHKINDFARSDKIEIMVMTIQSLDSDTNIFNRPNETTYDQKPIDIIKRTNPIVIIDEPQTTSGSQSRKNYIQQLNPLCTLQYSATHKKDKDVHKIYRLSAVDAYIKKLVKEIEVASVIPKNDHNYAYVKLVDVNSTKNKIYAKLELDVRNKRDFTVERKIVKVNPRDNLFDLTNGRELYAGMIVESIYFSAHKKSVVINGREINLGEAINSFDAELLKRIQIRKTIEEHLEKEKRLNPKGIKVLSLFFIDKVSNYRYWDKDEVIQGKYAKWFEEEYREAIKKYAGDKDIVAINDPVEQVHHGYFAEDHKHHFKNTLGNSADDERAYESIMKDKEYLLRFENKIRFIFTHSALREGWDNPNVFQICTLNESSKSNDRKRQEIGRGLRLCVNQDGERVYGFETNTLTIIANETYHDFAKQLQREIEEDENFKFGTIEPISFMTIETETSEGVTISIDEKSSSKLFDYCVLKGYIDASGNVTNELRTAIKTGKVEIPAEFKSFAYEILEYFKKVCGSLNIKDKENIITYRQNKRVVLDNQDFLNLWNRIKHKTKYSVNFDTEQFIKICSDRLNKELNVKGIEIEYTKSRIKQNTTGIDGQITFTEFKYISNRHRYLPDIISFLQNSTNLTRVTIVEILKRSKTLYMFSINPQRYMSDVSKIINEVLLTFILHGVKYTKIDGEEYYLQEVFPDEELKGCLINELVKSNRSVYEYNRYDSKIEKEFAEALQNDERVVVYTKLPTKKFVVPTPLGDYTPDWALVLNAEGTEKLYFVVETKGSVEADNLRNKELLKIRFGQKRFEDVGEVSYILADNYTTFSKEASKGNGE